MLISPGESGGIEGPWLITFLWQAIDGRAECVGLRVTSARDKEKVSAWMERARLPDVGIPITTTALRGIRLSELIAEERAKNAEINEFIFERETASLYTAPEAMRPATRKRLELAARTYRAAWQRGQHPTQAVAKRLDVTVSAAAKLVSRARKAGLLPTTSPGVAVGEARGDTASKSRRRGEA